MARIVLLDAGPTGLIISPSAGDLGRACRAWLAGLEAAGADVLIPTVVDFEVRRELLRLASSAKLRALDELKARLGIVDVGEAAFLRAAEFWAIARKAGKPTAHPEALDADTIIAGLAATIGEPWDDVSIATINVGHFSRFEGIDAQAWKNVR